MASGRTCDDVPPVNLPFGLRHNMGRIFGRRWTCGLPDWSGDPVSRMNIVALPAGSADSPSGSCGEPMSAVPQRRLVMRRQACS